MRSLFYALLFLFFITSNLMAENKKYALLEELGLLTNQDSLIKGTFTKDSITIYCNNLANEIVEEKEDLYKFILENFLSKEDNSMVVSIWGEFNDIGYMLQTSAYFYEIILNSKSRDIRNIAFNGFILNSGKIGRKLTMIQAGLLLVENSYIVSRLEKLHEAIYESQIKQIQGLPPDFIDYLKDFKRLIDSLDSIKE